MEDAGHPRLVPWRTTKEWEGVRDCFYPKNEGEKAEGVQRQACETTSMWASRCPLPHSVEATSFLTEVMLMNDFHISTQAKRLAMSMAIVRFVNGLLDPAQQAQYAIPLHTLAKTLHLPASFVEMRHAATHESLPSIEVLSETIRRALHWLYLHYWKTEQPHGKHLSPIMYEQITDLLKTVQKLNSQKVEQGRRTGPMYSDLAQRIIKVTGPHLLGEVLMKITIKDNNMLSGSHGSKPRKSEFTTWMPLLDAIFSMSEHIAQDFLMACVRFITYPLNSAECKEVLLPWVVQLCHQGGHGKKPAQNWAIDMQPILSACTSAPQKWSQRLVEQLTAQNPLLTQTDEPLLSKCKGATTSRIADTKRARLEDIEAEVTKRRKKLLELQQAEPILPQPPVSLSGWQQCEDWVSKPIGFWTE